MTEVHQRIGERPERSISDPVARTAFAVVEGKTPKASLGRLLVHFEFSLRTPPSKKDLQKQLNEALEDFTDEEREIPFRPSERRYWNRARHLGYETDRLHICLPCGLCVGLMQVAGTPAFIAAAHGPDDGVMSVDELIASGQQAIHAKTEAARRVAGQYSDHEWWLVLVDCIGLPGATKSELDDFSKALSVPAFWKRIVFFDMEQRAYQLHPAPPAA